MLLNNEWVINEMKEEIKKDLETNENKHTMQNLWDIAKAVLRGKFIALQAYLKIEKSQINNLTLLLKELEKQRQAKPRVSRRKEIIKIKAQLYYKETKRKIQRSKIHILFKCMWNIFKDRQHDRTDNLRKLKSYQRDKGLKLETNLKEKNSKTLKFMEII